MLVADGKVQGASGPALEQRRDQVHAGEFFGAVQGPVAVAVHMAVAHVAQAPQHPGAIGVDQRFTLDGVSGELEQLQGSRRVSDTEADRGTQNLAPCFQTSLEGQRVTAQRPLELKASLRVAADEHGRARLVAGYLHDRSWPRPRPVHPATTRVQSGGS